MSRIPKTPKSNLQMRHQKNMTGQEKYQLYSVGFTLIDNLLETDDYISAYLITFSMLEDRITSMWYRRKVYETGWEWESDGLRETNGGLQQQLFYLSFKGDIDQIMFDKIRSVIRDRNCLIHQTVMNLTNFDKEYVITLKKLFRELNKISESQKRHLKKQRTLVKTELLRNQKSELVFKIKHLEKQLDRVQGKINKVTDLQGR